MSARIAVAVTAGTPSPAASDERVIDELSALGLVATPQAWDSDADWEAFDLVVIGSVSDYASKREQFLAWAARVPQLYNPAGVLAWNSDKHYLEELAASGVAVVPTLWLEPEQRLGARGLHTRFPSLGDFVIKPAIGAGSQDTGRYTAVDGRSRGLAIDHAQWLLEHGRSVLMQRYVRSVDVSGERALYFIDGEFSHALRKEPMLTRLSEGAPQEEQLSITEASQADRDVALAALKAARAAVPDCGAAPFLYARVDLISGDGDEPLLLELELIKSQLGADLEPAAARRLANAIAARAAG